MTDQLLVTLGISLGIQAAFFVVAATFRTDKVTDLSYGLTFVAPNIAEVPEWRAAISAAIDSMAAKGTFSAELLAEVNGHLQDFRKGKVAEAGQERRP